MKTPTQTLMRHVMELAALTKRMDPGKTKERVEARYEEAKKALKAQRAKDDN